MRLTVAILWANNSDPWLLPNSRQIALQLLQRVIVQGKSIDAVLESDWYANLSLDPRDLAFARELTHGVCRWYFLLHHIVASYLKKPLRSKDKDVELVLLLGLYQLLVLKTDQHAAVNETVQLTVKLKKSWAKGLINGVLRNVIRSETEFNQYDEALSYPEWMRQTLQADWGEQAESVFIEGNRRAPMTLRYDTSQLSEVAALQLLSDSGIEATPHAMVPSALQLEKACAVEQIPKFAEGSFSVQDAAAQLAAPLLTPAAGERVLDACSAPGGKGLHLLQLQPDLDVTLLDISKARIERIRQNLQRAKLSARLLTGDAATPEQWWDGKPFDRILADVPCTGTGVIRRHPDIKIHRNRKDVLRLCDTQRKIINALWSLLKPGGVMLYSTCSILTQENEAQAQAFLQAQRDCREVVLEDHPWGERCHVGYRIAPGAHGMDGFYYAHLQKIA